MLIYIYSYMKIVIFIFTALGGEALEYLDNILFINLDDNYNVILIYINRHALFMFKLTEWVTNLINK